jgi:NAD(P)-dependent dehydrogenase (short-subunit alcohol dehydrogenase family)
MDGTAFEGIRLDGRVAVVTGGTGGWGSAAAAELAARGAAVVVNARSQDKIDALVARLRGAGAQASGVAADVRTLAAAQHVVATAVERYGHVDVLVNSMGAWSGALLEMTEQDWHEVISTDLDAVFACTKAAATQMVAQGTGGSIISLAGGAGMFGMAGAGAVAAAKGGVASAVWSWSDELRPHGITVNAIRGHVRSSITGGESAGFESAAAAPLVAWLASADAADITGTYLGIDGPRITMWEPGPPDTAAYRFPHWTAEELSRRIGPMIRRRPPRPRVDVLTDGMEGGTDGGPEADTEAGTEERSVTR